MISPKFAVLCEMLEKIQNGILSLLFIICLADVLSDQLKQFTMTIAIFLFQIPIQTPIMVSYQRRIVSYIKDKSLK